MSIKLAIVAYPHMRPSASRPKTHGFPAVVVLPADDCVAQVCQVLEKQRQLPQAELMHWPHHVVPHPSVGVNAHAQIQQLVMDFDGQLQRECTAVRKAQACKIRGTSVQVASTLSCILSTNLSTSHVNQRHKLA